MSHYENTLKEISKLSKELNKIKKTNHHLTIPKILVNHKKRLKKDILDLLENIPLDISALNKSLVLSASRNVFLFYILRNKNLNKDDPEHKIFIDLRKKNYYKRIAEAVYFDYLWVIHDKYETISFYQCCEMCNMDPEQVHYMFKNIHKEDVKYMIERYRQIRLN